MCVHTETETLSFPLFCWVSGKTESYIGSWPPRRRMALDIKSWEQTFQELIQQEKPRARWTLKLDEKLQPNSVDQGWKQYKQRAFGSHTAETDLRPRHLVIPRKFGGGKRRESGPAALAGRASSPRRPRQPTRVRLRTKAPLKWGSPRTPACAH
nr:receptor-transporting protein 4 isoform X2 [Loxodonta africana]